MTLRLAFLVGCLFVAGTLDARAQFGDLPLQTFGYFQTSFSHQTSSEHPNENTFSLQQLNLLFQTDLSSSWRAFVNFEVLNNFSSSRRWGSLDLDEAWVRYRADSRLNLKIGLHVPTFNHLNEIKNRTPLLPYVVRPLIYEESFEEIIDLEDFIPERAFVQAYGFFPIGGAKLDYAAYLGNSPNINSQFDNERNGSHRQTGTDTTDTFLVGGRVGLRYGELKLGLSSTYEIVNFFSDLADPLGIASASLSEVPRYRIGGDLSYYWGRFSLEGEFILVRYDEDPPRAEGVSLLKLDRSFFYGTLGYRATDHLFVYASYWYTEQALEVRSGALSGRESVDIEVPTIGASYTLLDRITLKGQYAYVNIDSDPPEGADRLHFIAAAVSVLF